MYCNVFMQKVIHVARLRTNDGLSFMNSTGSRVGVYLLKLQQQAVTVVAEYGYGYGLPVFMHINEHGVNGMTILLLNILCPHFWTTVQLTTHRIQEISIIGIKTTITGNYFHAKFCDIFKDNNRPSISGVFSQLLVLTLISYVLVICCDVFWNKGNNLYRCLYHVSFGLLTRNIGIYSYKLPER